MKLKSIANALLAISVITTTGISFAAQKHDAKGLTVNLTDLMGDHQSAPVEKHKYQSFVGYTVRVAEPLKVKLMKMVLSGIKVKCQKRLRTRLESKNHLNILYHH